MPTGPWPRDRRRAKRIPIEAVQAEVTRVGMTSRIPQTAVAPNPNLVVRLVDLSSGGLKMLSWYTVKTKDRVSVHLAIPSVKRSFHCHGVVKWCRDAELNGKPCFALGIEFLDLSGEDRVCLRELER
jgi:hypothetical protein